MKKQTLLSKIFVYSILLLGSLIFLFPLIWLISTSLKPVEQTMLIPPKWIPNPVQWRNYLDILTNPDIPLLLYAKNTLVICVLGVIGAVLSNALVAYGFARIEWPGRNILFGLTLATMMIPFPVTMIPLYSVFRKLHWIGTNYPLWAPAWLGGAFNIFLLRQFFMTIPHDLSEAARIDGCSEFRIFCQIILPLCRSSLVVVALFHFMGSWNDFLGPLIYLTRQETFTLSLGLQFFQSQHGGTQWHHLMAASTLMVSPIIILFFLTQKTFIQGIAMTGLKG